MKTSPMRSMARAIFALSTLPLLLLLHVPPSWAWLPTLVGDAYVSSGKTGANFNSNYGSATTLNVSGPDSKVGTSFSFLKFDLLSTLPAGTLATDVARATVTLFVGTVTTAGGLYWFQVLGSWDENTITYATRPPMGGAIAYRRHLQVSF